MIRLENSPIAAKMKAKARVHRPLKIVVPLSDQDVSNMRLCLNLKFTQNPHLAKELLQISAATLIEDIGNRHKPSYLFWGAKFQNRVWVGTNMLGKLLMDLRTDLGVAAS